MYFQNNRLQKMWLDKCSKFDKCKKSRFRRSIHKQHSKRSQTLLKFADSTFIIFIDHSEEN